MAKRITVREVHELATKLGHTFRVNSYYNNAKYTLWKGVGSGVTGDSNHVLRDSNRLSEIYDYLAARK